MKIFNKFKNKLTSLIERIKLSETAYSFIKAEAKMYEAMMSNIVTSSSNEWEDIKDANGNVITSICKGKTVIIDVDIVKMLAAGGFVYDKDKFTLNIIGL